MLATQTKLEISDSTQVFKLILSITEAFYLMVAGETLKQTVATVLKAVNMHSAEAKLDGLLNLTLRFKEDLFILFY